MKSLEQRIADSTIIATQFTLTPSAEKRYPNLHNLLKATIALCTETKTETGVSADITGYPYVLSRKHITYTDGIGLNLIFLHGNSFDDFFTLRQWLYKYALFPRDRSGVPKILCETVGALGKLLAIGFTEADITRVLDEQDAFFAQQRAKSNVKRGRKFTRWP